MEGIHLRNAHSFVCLEKEFIRYLPITVRLIFKFLVGELRKSTRHRYIPSSDSLILSTFNCAGVLAVLKNARCPNAVGDDVDFACVNGRPRTSKLILFGRKAHSNRKNNKQTIQKLAKANQQTAKLERKKMKTKSTRNGRGKMLESTDKHLTI